MTDASKLQSYVDRIENLETEAKALGLDKRSIFEEAQKAGYSAKALRWAIADKKRAAQDAEAHALLTQYRALLNLPGATYRSVAEQTGAKRSTLQRLVPKNERGTEPSHDPETGEINESCGGVEVPNGSAQGAALGTASAGVAPGPQDDMPAFLRRQPSEAA